MYMCIPTRDNNAPVGVAHVVKNCNKPAGTIARDKALLSSICDASALISFSPCQTKGPVMQQMRNKICEEPNTDQKIPSIRSLNWWRKILVASWFSLLYFNYWTFHNIYYRLGIFRDHNFWFISQQLPLLIFLVSEDI